MFVPIKGHRKGKYGLWISWIGKTFNGKWSHSRDVP